MEGDDANVAGDQRELWALVLNVRNDELEGKNSTERTDNPGGINFLKLVGTKLRVGVDVRASRRRIYLVSRTQHQTR